MMDSSALKHLEQSHKTGTEVSGGRAIVLGESFKLADLEKYQDHRARFRGRFETASLSAFVQYVSKRAGTGLPVFIDRDNMSAVSYLDIGEQATPGHCDHSARLCLDMTPEFRAFQRADGRALDQDDFVELIEDWGHLMTFENSEESALELRKVLHAIRKVSIEDLTSVDSDRQAHSSQTGVMNSVTVKNADRLPALIHWHFTPYAELDSVVLTMRVSSLTNGKPGFRLRVVALEAAKSEMANEFAMRIHEALPELEPMQGTFQP